MQTKPLRGSRTLPSNDQNWKKTMPSVGEDVEGTEPSNAAGGNVNGTTSLENGLALSQNIR